MFSPLKKFELDFITSYLDKKAIIFTQSSIERSTKRVCVGVYTPTHSYSDISLYWGFDLSISYLIFLRMALILHHISRNIKFVLKSGHGR